ncbi:cytochrome c nitrite reductase small subunit [Geobacter sp.]|uniref:cytochrome c nitrite reductase small subunit n=1 Tax=Geobacter sp. TaxID=46610 RepID=UPI002610A53F|nr:cytochrome c nitrite reductase small subunit [Geobacter sp.]
MVRIGVGNRVIYFVSGAFVAIAMALFLLVGPPQLLARSSTPDFCVRCHVMESEYESWIHTGAHRRIKCVDCHLPNEHPVAHYIWKSIDGAKDAFIFYSGRVPQIIRLSAHGKVVLQKNCVRCHETTVAHIDTERHCWNCHRRVSHTRSGAMETL